MANNNTAALVLSGVLLGAATVGGIAIALKCPPNELGKEALKTIQVQNDVLADQNEKLSAANETTARAIKNMPDNQQKFIDESKNAAEAIAKAEKAEDTANKAKADALRELREKEKQLEASCQKKS